MNKNPINLIFVSADNHNKYYNMIPINDSTWRAEWGRVEGQHESMTYPMSKWDSMYRNKTKKGYKDVTEFRQVKTVSSNGSFKPLDDPQIDLFINTLLGYSYHAIARDYTVTAEGVSKTQVDQAQKIINNLVNINSFTQQSDINNQLIELYHIIPRRMRKVTDHLWDGNPNSLKSIITNEQATLDVMAQQVGMLKTQTDSVKDKKDTTVLEALGINIVNIDDDERETILNLLGPNKNQFVTAYRVINTRTQTQYDECVNNAKNKSCMLFFHGSRNENWVNILDTGLILRPTNAVISGKMYGYGLYFADKAKKSIGYSSLRGSYWARGSDIRGYLGLFYVHVGNQLVSSRREPWMSDLSLDKLRARGEYDSVFAQGGYDLINNEYVVYAERQVTVGFIIELRS